ncbi:hypothetical protein HanIR_Chr13g0644161 [Helianthus annuus]|nr:hypothetical protein HanIR_Chr13g0644161 [Helianthus annuus]
MDDHVGCSYLAAGSLNLGKRLCDVEPWQPVVLHVFLVCDVVYMQPIGWC